MKLLVHQYPDASTIATCQEVEDDFDASSVIGALLMSPEDYQTWLTQAPQQAAIAALNQTAEAAAAAQQQAALDAKIATLTATGISQATAIALLNLQKTNL